MTSSARSRTSCSRRSFLVMFAAGTSALFAACSSGASTPGPATTEPSRAAPAKGASTSGGEAATKSTRNVTFGSDSPAIKTLDTGQANAAQTLAYTWPVFDGLTRIDMEGNLLPGLAKEWKNLDSRTWEFTLGDWTFHNRREVTAEDVVKTFERYRNPENNLRGASLFATTDGIEATGSKTVRITTKVPDPTIPNLLAYAMIVPMRELEEHGAEAFFQNPIGSGAFRVDQADFNNGLTYSNLGPSWSTPRPAPAIDQLKIQFIPEIATRVAALQSGGIDIARNLTPDSIRDLDPNRFKVVSAGSTSTTHFVIDTTTGPTTDVRVRQAINYAVDKSSLIQHLWDGYPKADGQLIGPSALGYNPDITAYPYDPARAKQLLSEAGYPDGFTLPMTVTDIAAAGKEIGEAVAAQLSQVGIQVDLRVQERALWISDFYVHRSQRPGLFIEILNWDQSFEANAVWRWFSSDLSEDGGRRWVDDTFDRMYQQAKGTFDREERARLYREAGKYLHEQAPVLFLWQGVTISAGRKELTWEAIDTSELYARLRWE